MKQIIEYINSQGRFRTKDELIENAFWFNLSNILSLVNLNVKYKDKLKPVNYFAINIAPSGQGKSFVYEQTKKLFIDLVEKYKQALEYSYTKATENLPNEDIIIDGNEVDLKSFLPDYELSIEGTREGLYLRAKALSHSFVGSLNIIHEEILDVISQSNLDVLKELYDGKFIGKLIKSNINENIYGIKSNMLIFGSAQRLKRDSKIYEMFNNHLSSGIYRRSFIFYQEPSEIIVSEYDYANPVNLEHIKKFITDHREVLTKGLPTIISLSNEAEEYAELINAELVEFANKYIDDERMSAEVGSFDKILKLSALHAIYKNHNEIKYENLEYAYDFYKRCRESAKTLFNIEPQHKRIYKVIKKLKKATKSEILENDIFNRLTFNEDIKLVEEYAYRKNEVLNIVGSKIKYFSIEPLPQSNLNKMIVSIPKVDKKEKTTDYIAMEIPFFNNPQSIEKLVLSEKISNFCLVHFENGKRKSDKTIEGQNMIGIDVDNGISLDEVLNLLKDYTYIIYTTKSHQKDKGGVICDRFRVVLPTKNKFYVDNDKHKQMLTNVCEALGIGSFDISTRNQDRLWFSNPNGKIYLNEAKLFDVIPFIPDTEIREKIEKQIEKFDENEYEEDEVKRRIGGMIKWVLNNTYSDVNRNSNLFRLGAFVLDLTGSIDEALDTVYYVDSMLDEPIGRKEIDKTIKQSLQRRA